MGKRKDEDVWNHMEKIPNGVKCKHCSTLFKGRPSASRLKSHLLRIPNQGISPCDNVPPQVMRELAGIDRRRKTDAAGSSRLELQSDSEEMGEGGREEIPVVHRAPVTEGTNIADMSQAPEARTMTQGIKMFTAAFVDDSFLGYVGKVWSWLMDENVQGVGLCGMGGIGKTEVAKYINNKLLSDPNPYHHVYWVGVSQNCTIRNLQNVIAEAMDLSLPSFLDVNICAARIWGALVNKKKSVLILDNVWESFDLQRVGIPIGSHSCKFIITSRIMSTCRKIGCQQIIKLDTLSLDQSRHLFWNTIGNARTLPTEIKALAAVIVKQCEGLPLGIVTIAQCMRGVVELRDWRNVSEELKGSQPRPEIMELFESLKLSYNALRKPTLKKVLLFCLLMCVRGYYCQDEDEDDGEGEYIVPIDKEIMTQYLVANRVTEGLESRAIEFDEMDLSLDLLEDVGLLQLKPEMTMHGLVKVMGILIKKESHNVMIELGNERLKDLPGNEKWASGLEEVFIINTNITRIGPNHVPYCPRLSSLYLCGNRYLESIDDSFFQYLSRLEVLDLSSTFISRLPDAVSYLVNLISLNVSYCSKLKGVPSLSKLAALKKLDMGNSGIVEVPKGIEHLSGLNYLNLSGTGIYELPVGLLSCLSGLQYLELNDVIVGAEVATLKGLEKLICGWKIIRDEAN